MNEPPKPDGQQAADGNDPVDEAYRGLTIPSPETSLHHRGGGWEGMSWVEFMDDTAVQTDLFNRNQPPRECRPIEPLPSQPSTMGDR